MHAAAVEDAAAAALKLMVQGHRHRTRL